MKSCSFFGHSEIEVTDDLTAILKTKILELLDNEFECFYFGGFGEFDHLCWQLVTELKVDYPNIRRVYCLSDSRHIRASKRPKYLKTENYEQFVYLELEFDSWYTRIYYRNCEMINISDFVIFYAIDKENSGAYKVYKYAKRIKKANVNLGESLNIFALFHWET